LIFRGLGFAVTALCALCLEPLWALALWSFTQIDHAVDDDGLYAPILVLIHLIGVSFWISALWPLRDAVPGQGTRQTASDHTVSIALSIKVETACVACVFVLIAILTKAVSMPDG
jgi:putative copper export protein